MTRGRALAFGAAGVLAGAVVLGAAALGFGWLGPAPPAIADAGDPAQVALGQRVYAEHCASCHGANLEGQPNWQARRPDGRLPAPPHDATGHTWHHPDAQLMELTRKGLTGILPGYESDMPAFEGVLTEAEVAAVIAFIKSTWPPDIRRRREERLGAAAGRS
ncbi:MAG: cytochrome c [Acetobacteraceae bacterium]|nr:cytochrome c [Acetobacteraceae bacterium]